MTARHGPLTADELSILRRGGPSRRDKAQDIVRSASVGIDPVRQANSIPYRPAALHSDPRIIGPRWPYAVMRIARILEGVAKSSNIEHAIEGAELKRLAHQYAEAYAFYLTRTRPPPAKGADHNPFRHLSDFDAFRRFIRCVEDICDRSTGKLGSWYTK